jgi:hypothetical protein
MTNVFSMRASDFQNVERAPPRFALTAKRVEASFVRFGTHEMRAETILPTPEQPDPFSLCLTFGRGFVHLAAGFRGQSAFTIRPDS